MVLAHPTQPNPQPQDVTHVALLHSEKDQKKKTTEFVTKMQKKRHAVRQQCGNVYCAPQNTGKTITSTLAQRKMRRRKSGVYRQRSLGIVGIPIACIPMLYPLFLGWWNRRLGMLGMLRAGSSASGGGVSTCHCSKGMLSLPKMRLSEMGCTGKPISTWRSMMDTKPHSVES